MGSKGMAKNIEYATPGQLQNGNQMASFGFSTTSVEQEKQNLMVTGQKRLGSPYADGSELVSSQDFSGNLRLPARNIHNSVGGNKTELPIRYSFKASQQSERDQLPIPAQHKIAETSRNIPLFNKPSSVITKKTRAQSDAESLKQKSTQMSKTTQKRSLRNLLFKGGEFQLKEDAYHLDLGAMSMFNKNGGNQQLPQIKDLPNMIQMSIIKEFESEQGLKLNLSQPRPRQGQNAKSASKNPWLYNSLSIKKKGANSNPLSSTQDTNNPYASTYSKQPTSEDPCDKILRMSLENHLTGGESMASNYKVVLGEMGKAGLISSTEIDRLVHKAADTTKVGGKNEAMEQLSDRGLRGFLNSKEFNSFRPIQRLKLIDEYKKIVKSEFTNKIFDTAQPVMSPSNRYVDDALLDPGPSIIDQSPLRDLPSDCVEDIETIRNKLKIMRDLSPSPNSANLHDDEEVKEYLYALNRNRRTQAGHKIYNKLTVDPKNMQLKVIPLSERRHEFGGHQHQCGNYKPPPKKRVKKFQLITGDLEVRY
ncbi:hypothetical protein FGO68_gene6968 [Halteria grandinella]|uniref:Uncharacterized protein n=1 Tax=Halteria grandinella TaxID=5974 RepID=A0A8J8NEH8_HALGN|nr:hypothetical protein FGO68_gene6968 [Halteria grandinella]